DDNTGKKENDRPEPEANNGFSTSETVRSNLARRLDDITRLVTDWVWETDENFHLKFLSIRVFEILGFHSLELVGRKLTDFGRFVAKDGTQAEIDLMSPFRDVSFETRDRKGSPRIFLVSGLPVYDPDTGEYSGVLGTARDVTEKQRAELALRDSERNLRTVVSNVPIVLFALDADGVFTLSEGKGLGSLGLEPGEIVGQSVFEVYKDYPYILRCVRQALEGSVVQASVEVGDQVFDCTYSPVKDEDDCISGVIGVAANITGKRNSHRERDESEERFRSLIEGSLLGIVIHRFGEPIFVNQAFATILGYDSPEEIIRLGSLNQLYHPDEIERIEKIRADLMAGRPAPPQFDIRARRRDGTEVLLEAQARVVNWCGSPVIQSTVVDITDRQRMLDDLKKLSVAVEQSPASVMITDPDGTIEYVNDKFVELTGFSADESIGQNSRILKSGKTPPDRYEEMWRTITAGREWRGELHNRKKNGESYWEYASISPVKNADGVITNYIAVKEDITLRKENEKRLIQQANYDEVTTLPNRVLAFDRLSQGIESAKRNRDKVGLLFIDLDRFKAINDTLGHAVGDRALKEAGERIRSCLRAEDTVARLGGDEFAVIMTGLKQPMDAEPITQKIMEAFTPPFILEGREIFLTPSIGITISPDDGTDPASLMSNADAAMYQAKESGRNNYWYFTPELNKKAHDRLFMENQIRQALEKGEFSLHYQPIIDLRSGQIIAAEALLRWTNEELGSVGPDTFVPLAEEIGLIGSIGEWVLQAAGQQFGEWQRNDVSLPRISINVSSRQFRSDELMKAVMASIRESGATPEAVELEITENLLMADTDKITEILGNLREMGVRLSIDDFGTGYSSLSYLRRFPVNCLKIDKSFVQDVTVDDGDAKLVEAIINMARSLKLEVVAEGVETDDQMEFLRVRGCDFAQGYYFSKPVPGDEFARLFANWRPETFIDDSENAQHEFSLQPRKP
ncbi:MAG: EAL domain-containing protein, partial [Rhodospirillales bacterium]|nr:EAL domain-containing protein [Rhodospirillales bacterium]